MSTTPNRRRIFIFFRLSFSRSDRRSAVFRYLHPFLIKIPRGRVSGLPPRPYRYYGSEFIFGQPNHTMPHDTRYAPSSGGAESALLLVPAPTWWHSRSAEFSGNRVNLRLAFGSCRAVSSGRYLGTARMVWLVKACLSGAGLRLSECAAPAPVASGRPLRGGPLPGSTGILLR